MRDHYLSAAWGIVVGVLLLMPVDEGMASSWLPPAVDAVADKLVHGALFLVAALAFARSTRALRAPRPLLLAVLAAVAYGGLLEVIQGFVGRDMSWGDVGADAIGAVLALPFWMLASRVLR